VTLAEAARVLGIRRQSVQKRITRGTLQTRVERSGNRHRVLVQLPDPLPQPVQQAVPEPGAHPVPDARDVELAVLRERLTVAEARVDELKSELATERVRVDGLIAALAEQPTRRPWPGLKAWWRRVWEGKE
jgi:hypothetical protein